MRFFCIRDLCFNPTVEAVSFCLLGWCVLCVFLLPAFTHLGHKYQDLLRQFDEMHGCTDWTLVCALIGKFFLGNGVRTHVNSKRKIPTTGRPQGGSNPGCCITQDSEPKTLTTELFLPSTDLLIVIHYYTRWMFR